MFSSKDTQSPGEAGMRDGVAVLCKQTSESSPDFKVLTKHFFLDILY